MKRLTAAALTLATAAAGLVLTALPVFPAAPVTRIIAAACRSVRTGGSG